MVKKKNFIILMFIFLIISSGLILFASSSDPIINLNAEIKKSVLAIEISDSSLNLGETTAGYELKDNITIRNIGNTKIKIETEITGEYDPLFNYLKLNSYANCASAGWGNVMNFTSKIIDRPPYGEKGDPVTICLWLDLREYGELISTDRNITSDINFWLVQA
jgi:hypothetical protein